MRRNRSFLAIRDTVCGIQYPEISKISSSSTVSVIISIRKKFAKNGYSVASVILGGAREWCARAAPS
jgi:hypothetical protein